MNLCRTHNQEYDPATGWCPYCGKPGDGGAGASQPKWPSPMPPYRLGGTKPVTGTGGDAIVGATGGTINVFPSLANLTAEEKSNLLRSAYASLSEKGNTP